MNETCKASAIFEVEIFHCGGIYNGNRFYFILGLSLCNLVSDQFLTYSP